VKKQGNIIRTMVIQLLMIAFGFVLAISAAHATVTEKRFELRKTTHGIMRLDRKTGTISICSRNKIKWQCDDINSPANTVLHDSQKTFLTPAGQALIKVHRAFQIMLHRFSRFTQRVILFLF